MGSVFTKQRQEDLLTAGVRKDDLYIDHGVSGGRARRPQFDAACEAFEVDDNLVVTTFDGLGRSTANMLELSKELRGRG